MAPCPVAAMSLCLQYAAEAPLALNLLPDEWRTKRRAAALRQRLIRGAIAVGAVYALALAIFLALLAVRVIPAPRRRKRGPEPAIELHAGAPDPG